MGGILVGNHYFRVANDESWLITVHCERILHNIAYWDHYWERLMLTSMVSSIVAKKLVGWWLMAAEVSMASPDLVSYNTVLHGCASAGRWQQVLQLCQDVVKAHLAPNRRHGGGKTGWVVAW